MTDLLHELVSTAAVADPDALAVVHEDREASYGDLQADILQLASALVAQGFQKQDRLAVYLPKQLETIISIFGATQAGGIIVPVNPVLKPRQVSHILRDSGATVLVTDSGRMAALQRVLGECKDLDLIVLSGRKSEAEDSAGSFRIIAWDDLLASAEVPLHRVIDVDVAGILYTSGSTGNPKGVVLSHRNMVAGAKSVSSYLDNNKADRILSALPLSFDAGFSQVSTAFFAQATLVLHNFYFPGDLVKVSQKKKITGLTAVPPLWAQIVEPSWPDDARKNLRYFANTGGKMPRMLLHRLRELFPNAKPFLMYGLTEAFRSTYLPPAEVDRRPDSIGKAIPNAEILVLREDGTECKPGEAGELVHRGALVAQGYWNAPELTKERFRPFPLKNSGLPIDEIAVWSGDAVRTDEEGFLYFVGRKDDMIKTSGYRVSPTEVEEAGFESGLVKEMAALGVPDERLGQKIIVFAVPVAGKAADDSALLDYFRSALPAFMVPAMIQWRDELPKSANGKIDRKLLAKQLHERFEESDS